MYDEGFGDSVLTLSFTYSLENDFMPEDENWQMNLEWCTNLKGIQPGIGISMGGPGWMSLYVPVYYFVETPIPYTYVTAKALAGAGIAGDFFAGAYGGLTLRSLDFDVNPVLAAHFGAEAHSNINADDEAGILYRYDLAGGLAWKMEGFGSGVTFITVYY